jgi:hypothetical protein
MNWQKPVWVVHQARNDCARVRLQKGQRNSGRTLVVQTLCAWTDLALGDEEMHLVVRKQRLFADIKAREDKVGGARSPVGLCGKLDVGARTQTGKTAFLDPVRR